MITASIIRDIEGINVEPALLNSKDLLPEWNFLNENYVEESAKNSINHFLFFSERHPWMGSYILNTNRVHLTPICEYDITFSEGSLNNIVERFCSAFDESELALEIVRKGNALIVEFYWDMDKVNGSAD